MRNETNTEMKEQSEQVEIEFPRTTSLKVMVDMIDFDVHKLQLIGKLLPNC